MKRECVECGRPVRYFSSRKGRLVARRDHDLCRQCFKSLIDSGKVKEVVFESDKWSVPLSV
jgi:ribosomal protein S14